MVNIHVNGSGFGTTSASYKSRFGLTSNQAFEWYSDSAVQSRSPAGVGGRMSATVTSGMQAGAALGNLSYSAAFITALSANGSALASTGHVGVSVLGGGYGTRDGCARVQAWRKCVFEQCVDFRQRGWMPVACWRWRQDECDGDFRDASGRGAWELVVFGCVYHGVVCERERACKHGACWRERTWRRLRNAGRLCPVQAWRKCVFEQCVDFRQRGWMPVACWRWRQDECDGDFRDASGRGAWELVVLGCVYHGVVCERERACKHGACWRERTWRRLRNAGRLCPVQAWRKCVFEHPKTPKPQNPKTPWFL